MAEVPRIFISATSRDLGSVRRDVKDRLITLGYLPVEQEHFGLHPGTIRSLLREKIERCDAVLHIVGQLYGTAPPPEGPERRSYTQIEYDLAREFGRPLYLLVCDENFPFDPHEPEGAEESSRQRAHRDAILRGDHKYDLVSNPSDVETLLGTLAIQLEDLRRETQETHKEITAHEYRSKRRFLGLAALVAVACTIGAVLYWQVSRQRGELEQTRQLQQAMLVRMLPANDPLRADSLRGKVDDAQAYRRLLVRELAPQFGLTPEEAGRRLEREADAALRDSHRDAKDKAQQLVAAGRFEEATRLLDESIAAAARPLRELLTAKGDTHFAAYRLRDAEDAYRQAAGLVDEKTEPVPWSAAQARIAESLEEQRRYSDSEPIRRRIAEMSMREGGENPHSAAALNNYASVLWHLRRYTEAEPLYRRALQLNQAKFGAEHASVSAVLNNLGALYSARKDYVHAESLYRSALEKREQSLGPEHPEVAESLNNLAELYIRLDRYPEAEPSLVRAIKIWEKKLGPDHPDVATGLKNLGVVYRNQERFLDAKGPYERALAIREKAFGEEHPDVAKSLHDLGVLCYRQNDLVQAEKFFARALAIQQKTGPESLELALTLHNLAAVSAAAGKPEEADRLYQHELRIREKILGADDPGVALSLESYAAFLRETGKESAATQAEERAKAIRAKLARANQ